jgi:hypothetical protein
MSDEDKSDAKAAEAERIRKLQEANANMNNSRLARMAEISDNSEEARAAELEGLDPSERTEKAAEAETQEAERYARALQTEGVDADKTSQDDSDTKVVNGETYYRQIVNGAEKWQTLKQIRETAQKVESGDEYLGQASESVRNASRLALSTPKDEPGNLKEDEMADLLRRVALGEEEAIKTLAPILARPSVNETDVLQKVDQRMSFRTELASLESQSKDLLEDQYMGRLFRSRLNEMKQEKPETSLREAYTSIDQELRTAFPGFKADKTQSKLERKRSLPAPITASARQTNQEPEESDEDNSSVIEEMAKKRGYTAHVHRRQ